MNPNLRQAATASPRTIFHVYHKVRHRTYLVEMMRGNEISIVKDTLNVIPGGVPNKVLFDAGDQKHLIVLQWTGMRDTNQQDLFEGDVVAFQGGPRAGQEAVVVWHSGSWLLWCDPPDDNGQILEMLFVCCKEIIRLGSRYELDQAMDVSPRPPLPP